MASLVARDCRVELPTAALRTGSASGDLKGVATHVFCCKFGDYSTVFVSQTDGVGTVVVAWPRCASERRLSVSWSGVRTYFL